MEMGSTEDSVAKDGSLAMHRGNFAGDIFSAGFRAVPMFGAQYILFCLFVCFSS